MGRALGKSRLVNVESMARKHPDTFKIADRSMRERHKKGDLVKLIWEEKGRGAGGERMWVKVTEVARNGSVRYEGELNNAPVVVSDLELGDKVKFGPQHVASAGFRYNPLVGLAGLAGLGLALWFFVVRTPAPATGGFSA